MELDSSEYDEIWIKSTELTEVYKLFENAPSQLFHYTNSEALLGMLGDKVIRASGIYHLNDDSELQLSLVVVDEALEWAKVEIPCFTAEGVTLIQDNLDSLTDLSAVGGHFVVSFSQNGDLLSQWARYAGPGGYSIGFDVVSLGKLSISQGGLLLRVVYDHDRQIRILKELLKVAEVHYALIASHANEEEAFNVWFKSVTSMLLTVSLFFKHPAFQEEDEWRIVLAQSPDDLDSLNFRSGRFGIVPFVELPIRQEDRKWILRDFLVSYSHYAIQAEAALKALLLKSGVDLSTSHVTTSEIPLKWN